MPASLESHLIALQEAANASAVERKLIGVIGMRCHVLVVILLSRVSLGTPLKFHDGFEEGSSSWHVFEELVTSCYAENVASVGTSDTTSYGGDMSLAVWSNFGGSVLSNHVIAGRNIFDRGVDDRIRYKLKANLPAASFDTTQVGPEFSYQNTRLFANGTSYTTIGGIQYIASKYFSDKWNIWVETSPNIAKWVTLPALGALPTLQADVWYKFKLKLDFIKDEYISLMVADTTTGVKYKADLRGIRIAKELRGFDAASVITLEAENLYSNCGSAGVFQSVIYYDSISVDSK